MRICTRPLEWISRTCQGPCHGEKRDEVVEMPVCSAKFGVLSELNALQEVPILRII